MLIISTFEHTLRLEEALAELEQSGIDKDGILVVPMDQLDKSPYKPTILGEETKVRGFEIGMAFATGCGVIGASLGFEFTWGPITWGLIYAFIGFWIGFGGVYFNRIRKKGRPHVRSPRRPHPEVAVIVQCSEAMCEETRRILWHYRAISVGSSAEPASG